MDRTQMELANELLQAASDRLKGASGDVSAFNLLSALQIEHLETQTHSKIIFYLLSSNSGQNVPNNFLSLFLRALDIPQKFLNETWNVYRERAFDSGAGRIDFVIESKPFCAIIEMKIDAGDGDSQLMRYEAFPQQKGKEYLIYYLTLDGHPPEQQSAGGIDANRLRCISFKREITSWLRACMKCVDKRGYQYSFLKQYLGAVNHITGNNDEVISVKDLLSSSEMARAAQLVANSFREKMEDVKTQFFRKLNAIIKRKTKLETCLFPNGIDVYLKEFTYKKHSYRVILFIDLDPSYLEAGISFCEILHDEFALLTLDEAEKTFPSIYRTWMEKLEALDGVPKFKHWPTSRYFYLEDSRGAQLNFKDHTAQIALLDEMDQQCRYISNYLISLIIKPLLHE